MARLYHHPADVFAFLADELRAGHSCALIVVTDIEGGAMRARGAVMAVRTDGRSAGYISNGCVDGDIIFQAKAALSDGVTRQLRYGEGSPFKDITLPCGGSIDVVVVPRPEPAVVEKLAKSLKDRKGATAQFDLSSGLSVVDSRDDGWVDTSFFKSYVPKLRIRIAGRGAAVRALAMQATESGFEVLIQSPDIDEADNIESLSFDHLVDPARPPDNDDDSWTALVLLFHDHDWEIALLEQALAGPAFYIGAMGSVRTHAMRRDALREGGLTDQQIARIHAPIGLIPAMRDANLLALSTLSEIVSIAQKENRL